MRLSELSGIPHQPTGQNLFYCVHDPSGQYDIYTVNSTHSYSISYNQLVGNNIQANKTGLFEASSTTNTIHLVKLGLDNATGMLPPALNTGLNLGFKIVESGYLTTFTVDPSGSETVEGNSNLVITGLYDYVEIFSDGTEWFIRNQL